MDGMVIGFYPNIVMIVLSAEADNVILTILFLD